MTACWKKTCINHHIRCSSRSFYCDDSLRDYKFLDEFCPITTGNKTNYDFGLFEDALQSGIVGVTYFPQKFLHCLRWGLQNLRLICAWKILFSLWLDGMLVIKRSWMFRYMQTNWTYFFLNLFFIVLLDRTWKQVPISWTTYLQFVWPTLAWCCLSF